MLSKKLLKSIKISCKCEVCDRDYRSSLKLKLLYSRVHAPNTFKCTQSPRSFGSSLILRGHIRDSHSISVCRYCGNYCDKKFSQISSLNIHLKSVHENGNTLICNWYGKKLNSKSKLKEHITKHTKHKIVHVMSVEENLLQKNIITVSYSATPRWKTLWMWILWHEIFICISAVWTCKAIPHWIWYKMWYMP